MRENRREQVTKTSYLQQRFLRLRFLGSIPKFLIALLLPLVIILGLAIIEGNYLTTNQKPISKECDPKNNIKGALWLRCQLKNSETVNLIEGYSIIAAAILFALEYGDRKKQSHSQSWQMIDGAKDIETSYARYHALQDLNKDNVSLKGVDIPNADLPNIDLRVADLREANLKGAKLKRANLQHVNLENADLECAELTKANLNGADLYLANLEAANLNQSSLQNVTFNTVNLQNARLYEADLQGANLENANLKNAVLRGANLKETVWKNADIKGTDLRGVKNLSLLQVQDANNWEKAIYDQNFHPEKPQLIREMTLEDDSQLIGDIKTLNEVTQKIDRALQIINIETSESTSNTLTPLLSEVKTYIEFIMEQNVNYDTPTKEKIMDKLADLKEGVTTREKGKQLKEYDQVAGQWLDRKREDIKCIAGNTVIENNNTLTSTGNILDSSDKVERFYQDINNLLKELSFYISKSQRPKPIYEGVIKLGFPKFLYRDAFIIIVDKIIPEMMNEEPNQLSETELERLNGHLHQFIDWLQSTSI